MWTCGDCGTKNETFRTSCRNCGTNKPTTSHGAESTGSQRTRRTGQDATDSAEPVPAPPPGDHRTWEQVWSSLPESTRVAVTASVAAAPPFPPQSAEIIRRVFAGAGAQIAARRQQAA
ncbi:hypothetical protein Ssi03_61960 [Sphaerisporangium siamense]|nr:hypothetical protein Ssi03_61960 [Sphaerisporangium siamense]